MNEEKHLAILEAEKLAEEGLGLTKKQFNKELDWYLAECHKVCYGPRVLVKGSVHEYGAYGVYVCTGCGYAYPPSCNPPLLRKTKGFW